MKDAGRLAPAAVADFPAGKSAWRPRAEHPFHIGLALFAITASAGGFVPGLIDPSRAMAR